STTGWIPVRAVLGRQPCSLPTSCFFVQAGDGIRVFHVTGVQTCALPISAEFGTKYSVGLCTGSTVDSAGEIVPSGEPSGSGYSRSEERRVGKECSARLTPRGSKTRREQRVCLYRTRTCS